MERWRLAVVGGMVLALPLGGCEHGFGERDLLPVGTCVRVSDEVDVAVPCTEPHTHKVIAIAPRAEACPGETVIYESPADPNDGTVTVCYSADGE